MKTLSALITDPNRQKWFEKHLPRVRVFAEVCQEFFKADILLISDKYQIGERSFQVKDAWERYLMVRHPEKVLVIYTARQYPGKQCICLSDSPEHLNKRLNSFLEVGERPEYPDYSSTWENLVEIVSKALVSHTENNLRSRISNLRKSLQHIEENLYLEQPLQVEDWEMLDQDLKKMPSIWEGAYMYFRLFPFFQQLNKWQELYVEILAAFGQKEDTLWLEQKYSGKLSEYLKDPVRYISEMYHFEPYE